MTFESLRAKIGAAPLLSDWCAIDQARIDAFADVTEDHQFIHVDPEAAAQTPFGGTVAHGFLTLSLLSKFAAECLTDIIDIEGFTMTVNYGFQKVRFVEPVRSGARVRGTFVLKSAEQRVSGRTLLCYDSKVEIEGGEKPALVAEWLALVLTSDA